MLQKLQTMLFSTRMMAFLFIAFAGAMAAGTFIEDAYNTDTARIWIYNAWWFEAIMVFFLINFFGNIKKYQLLKKEKWATLILHLSWILIIIGAFVTRYFSYEGMLLVKEGGTSSEIYSDMPYFTAFVDGKYKGEMRRKNIEEKILFAQETNNSFSFSDKFDTTDYSFELQEFIMNATPTLVADNNGKLTIKIVEATAEGRKNHFLVSGETAFVGKLLFAFNKQTNGAVNITENNGKYNVVMPTGGTYMRMADKKTGNVIEDIQSEIMFRSLYNLGEVQFVFPDQPTKGTVKYVSNNNYQDKTSDDAIILKTKAGKEEKTVTLLGAKGKQGEPVIFKLNDLEFTLFYGSKVHFLPFKIKLDDFIAEKFPGTDKSYSSFKSKIEVQNGKDTFKDSIFMNNVLDYKGYRFFQAGFEPDEKGTRLSVSHDFWGTWITYIGYFLLYFGMMAILFDKNTRFADLKKKLDKIAIKKQALSVLVFFFSLIGFSQENHDGHNHEGHNHENHQLDTQPKETSKSTEKVKKPKMPTAEEALFQIKKYAVTPEHADKFGHLVIQDISGRMKPINTFSSELLRKVSKSDTYEDLTSDQVLISMNQFPELWYQIPLIYLKPGNDSIRKIIGVDKKTKYAPLIKFFDEDGNYKIGTQSEKSYQAGVPNAFEKDFIEADKKVNLLYSAITGQILKVFPIPQDENNKWLSYMELSHDTKTEIDKIKNIIPFYFNEVLKASQTGNYTSSESLLTGLSNYQKKIGAKVMLSDDKVNTEILYNKYDIFKKLFSWYMYAGLLMFLFVILKLFYDKKWIKYTVNFFHGLTIFLFVLHVAGLMVRAYISGHAPWSDAYESMIYVAFATMFFGIALGGVKSQLTVASSAFVAAMILMIAHWNWMDPTIANLQPVLDSYWLMIHVAVIVGSYGPFTLAFILGLVALFLMIFSTAENKTKMELNIKEITYINELALTVGLVMLTIGNFLGGQWANESWGRYWGWDPKETWALISIMIYAFVIHARFVPALRGLFTYNFMSVLAFASILMTYFGVNFHLSGLHSYASGEKQNVTYYGYAFIVVLMISAAAYTKYKKHYKK
jgi:cytochrome c-type biogenesis protein CcsB